MRTIVRCWMVLVLLPAMWMASVMPGAAEPPAPDLDTIKARLWRESAELLPLPEVQAEELEAEAQAAPGLAAVGDWSKIAFESYRNGDWEIYLAHGDGSNPVRLTFSEAAEFSPRLNRGATRVVFTSNRDGNWEIYTVGADGSGLARLTATAAGESDPVWSPDGSHILFASDQDGNRELYTIRPDGAGLTRITNDPSYDSMPCWSPDGMQIAWMRRTSETQGVIMVANADGSNVHPITQPWTYMQHPAWSPDGSKIAFDCDNDGDTWNELVLINADGSGWKEIEDPSYADTPYHEEDDFAAGFSPDGVYVLYSRIVYQRQGNELYLRNASVRAYNLNNRMTPILIQGGFDWFPDWQSLDATPPVAQLTPLPLFSPAGGFTVSWSGGEVGPAGLKGYEVHYRHASGGGPWALWQMTLATSAVFPGEPGNAYAFRVRGWDNAWNTTPWRGDAADTQTWVYSAHVQGQVRDLRGEPLPGPFFAINPVPLYFAAGLNGRYEAYFGAPGSYGIITARPGYELSLPVNIRESGELSALHILAAPGNLVHEGQLEQEDAAWQASGDILPTISGEAAHSGVAGTSFGAKPGSTSEAVGRSTLSQAVTIPAEMTAPTLSLLYRVQQNQPSEQDRMTVSLQSGGTTRELGILPPSGQWAHTWYDLTEWAGQTVTITLALDSAEDGAFTWVSVDEVTVADYAPLPVYPVALPLLIRP